MIDPDRNAAIQLRSTQVQLAQDWELLRTLQARLLETQDAIKKAHRAYRESLEVLARIDHGVS